MTLRTGKFRRSDRRGKRAFTLIELILVMTILSVVLGIVAPQLSRFFRGRTLDSEVHRFLSLTRYGQSRAVSEGSPMLLWVDAKLGTYGLRQEGTTGDGDVRAVDYTVAQDLQLEAADIQTRSAPVGQAEKLMGNLPMIRFTPDGFIADTSPQTIWMKQGKDENTMVIRLARDQLHYEIYTNDLRNLRR